MRLVAGAALATALAGGAVIVLGFILGLSENRIRRSVKEGLDQSNQQLERFGSRQEAAPATFDPTEYTKQLAEFAKALSGLSQASQAFLIASILFAFTVALAAADVIVSQ